MLAEAAIEAAVAAMRDPVALEFDLSTGKRGERDDHARSLLCALTGAEDATVVNNNAAAVLLCLNTLADGRDAIVSRGELIEIGGAFRMPDIMARAGARLIEVGTTNRTHPQDYRAALNERTGVILKVHTSNYRIQGFTAEVSAAELAAIAAAANVPLINDLGSGTLVDLSCYGLQKEPTVREAVAAGNGVVTFSGDKLLGGPQAGFIVGTRALIAAINRNPMKRALRVDKIQLAAIEATLKLYRDPDRLAERLPTLRLLARSRADIEAQARRLMPAVAVAIGTGFTVSLCDCRSQIGSGALPLDTIASAGLAIRSHAGAGALDQLAASLRGLPRPVIGRIAWSLVRLFSPKRSNALHGTRRTASASCLSQAPWSFLHRKLRVRCNANWQNATVNPRYLFAQRGWRKKTDAGRVVYFASRCLAKRKRLPSGGLRKDGN